MNAFSLLDAAREVPRHPALIVDGKKITFARLAKRVRSRLGELAGDAPLPVVGTNDLETLVTLYALMEAGRPAVLMHPRWTESERQAFLDVCRSFANGEDGDDDEKTLAIVPTSGSSGTPRGVVLSRRAFAASARASAANLGWRDDDRWLLSLPIAHVGGLSILTRCLAGRRTAVVGPTAPFHGETVLRYIVQQKVTLLSVVPTMLHRLMDAGKPPASLRAVLVGGAAAAPALVAEALENGWPVLATYGMTETCSQIATWRPGRPAAGIPLLDGVEVRIQDSVVEVRGAQLLSATLPPSEILDPDGWFRTRDIGHLDENGQLHISGRRDTMIISGGENVLAEEVEAALLAHSAIRAAVVFAVPDDTWGELVAAAVVPRGVLSDERLRADLQQYLAPFKLPRRIAAIDDIVLLASGKVDRRATAELARPRLRAF